MTSRRGARTSLSAVLLLAALHPACGTTAETGPVVVERRGAAYTASFDALIDAPPRRVYEVLTDFSGLRALNPDIVAVSAKVAADGRGERVRTVLQSCIWLFCRKVVQVEDVVEPDARTILSRIVPGQGDFKSGWTTWHLSAQGVSTHLHYEASRVPNFWIPPLIGSWAVATALREQLEASIPVIERLAAVPPPARP
jgi:hypothetical protein